MKRSFVLLLIFSVFLSLCACTAGETVPVVPETTAAVETQASTELETTPPTTMPDFDLSTWQGQYDMGLYHMENEAWQEAISAFDAAIALDPAKADAYAQRGNARILSGETEENLTISMDDYQQALNLDETNALAYLGVIDIHIRRGEYDEAEAAMEDAKEKTNNDPLLDEKCKQLDQGRFVDSSNVIRYSRKLHYNGDGTYCGYVITEYENGSVCCVKSFDAEGNSTGCVEVSTVSEDNVTVKNWYHIDHRTNELSVVVEKTLETTTTNQDGTYDVETVSFDSDSKRTSSNHTYFDAEGRAVRKENYDANGNMRSYDISEYDSAGNEIRIDRYFPDGTLDQYILYEYNDYGKYAKCEFFNGNNELTSYVLYYYNEQGKILGTETYRANGELLYSSMTD